MNYIVTGLICSGKSTLLNTAMKHGFNALKADDVVSALCYDKVIITKLKNSFKDYEFEENPKEAIKQLFFKSESDKIKIENIFHPRVHEIIKNKLESSKNILIEVPPLKNNISIIKNNKSIFMDLDIKTRRKRFQTRDTNNNLNYFDKINKYQADCLLIDTYCDIIIKNSLDKNHLNEYFKTEIIKS